VGVKFLDKVSETVSPMPDSPEHIINIFIILNRVVGPDHHSTCGNTFSDMTSI